MLVAQLVVFSFTGSMLFGLMFVDYIQFICSYCWSCCCCLELASILERIAAMDLSSRQLADQRYHTKPNQVGCCFSSPKHRANDARQVQSNESCVWKSREFQSKVSRDSKFSSTNRVQMLTEENLEIAQFHQRPQISKSIPQPKRLFPRNWIWGMNNETHETSNIITHSLLMITIFSNLLGPRLGRFQLASHKRLQSLELGLFLEYQASHSTQLDSTKIRLLPNLR